MTTLFMVHAQLGEEAILDISYQQLSLKEWEYPDQRPTKGLHTVLTSTLGNHIKFLVSVLLKMDKTTFFQKV